MALDEVDWRLLVGVSLLSGTLFVSPMIFPIEVRVIVESVGDVSGLLAGVWSFLTGVATFASLALAAVNYHREREPDAPKSPESGPDTAIHIDGVEGDLNLVLGEEGRIEGYEQTNEDGERSDPRDRENS